MAEYSFITEDNFRIDAKGRNPKQAYKQAKTNQIEVLEKIKNNNPELLKHMKGAILPYYIKYDRNGIAAIDAWRSLKK